MEAIHQASCPKHCPPCRSLHRHIAWLLPPIPRFVSHECRLWISTFFSLYLSHVDTPHDVSRNVQHSSDPLLLKYFI